MSNFSGGSVYSMVQGIASGTLLVTEKTYKRLTTAELQQLAFELDRQIRLTRSDQPNLEDNQAVQLRHRTIQKLTAALMMLRSHQQRRK